MDTFLNRFAAVVAALALAGCNTPGTSVASSAPSPASSPPEAAAMFSTPRVTVHRGQDDLLTAGLGLAGLRSPVAPAFADPLAPTTGELRRRAIWHDWRGIVDLMPAGGYAELYGSVADVPGREFNALATLPGATQPHRVLLQLPDAFDTDKRCVLVAPASGSRGVYGAIAVAGAWGLPKGCAVVYTDKGAGSDYFDLDAGLGVRADRGIGPRTDTLAFEPQQVAGASGVAVKHAHSQDNPEADWGRHVQQAARFALQVLNDTLPQAAPFTRDNTRIIAVGISNGGGAVLRAAQDDGAVEGGWFDAVVAGAPNIHVDSHGGRPLYDFATQAALLMPCALLDFDDLGQSPLTAAGRALGTLRCTSLAQAGLLQTGVTQGDDEAAQAASAHALLNADGWSDAALRAGALSVEFDLWRAVAVTYASAYGRYAAGEHPCGFYFSAQDAAHKPRPATVAERAAWPADAGGIPPGAGVGIIDTQLAPPDFVLPGVQCLRALWTGTGADAERVRAGVTEVQASLPRAGLPVVVIHGTDDGLLPPAFTSAPYVARAQAAGRDVRYWQVRNAQHFDAFLALPDYGARYLPLLPYVYVALDRVAAHLDGDGALPADALIENTPRGAGQALTLEHLAIPE